MHTHDGLLIYVKANEKKAEASRYKAKARPKIGLKANAND